MKDASGSKHYELLKQCYAMIDGIPSQRLDLYHFRTKRSRSIRTLPTDGLADYQIESRLHDCGTLFCAGGFCAIYPPFHELGIHPDTISYVPLFKGRFGFSALSAFFGLPHGDAELVFGRRSEVNSTYWTYSELNKLEGYSDKTLWMKRCEAFLESKKCLDRQLASKGDS